MSRKYLGKNINQTKIKENTHILDPIIRQREQSKYKGLHQSKYGIDIWNAYEFSYLDKYKSPHLVLLEIIIPSKSAITIESTSMKIYLNSFFNKEFSSSSEIIKRIKDDLSKICKISVKVKIRKLFPKKPSSKSLINNKNRLHVISEAIVPGAYFILPILKNVRKNKLNFLIILCNRNYNFRCYSFSFSN